MPAISEQLTEKHRFMGRTLIDNVWRPALIILQPDLKLHIFLPGKYRLKVDEENPKSIEGQVGDWKLSIVDGPSLVSFSPNSFDSLNQTMKLMEEEKGRFLREAESKIWTEITFVPNTCIFSKIGAQTNIPDEWGITFYPGKNNSILFHFFSGDRNPRLLRSNIFTIADKSNYFSNSEKWNFVEIQKRLKLLTSCLSFFTGAPVSYELLVGKSNKEILFVQFKNESNPNAYICASPYNANIGLKKTSLSTFSSVLVKSIEKLFTESKHDRIEILLSYFGMLYMAAYDEAKIALSFQLMEALAKYKGIRLQNSLKNDIKKDLLRRYKTNLCPSCYGLIEKELLPEYRDLDEYLESALASIMPDKSFKVSPSSIKEIARRYRNEIFHGDIFKDMEHIDAMIASIPKGFQRDLPLVFQAIVSMIGGVHFILGIDFKEMIALKRTMYE